MEGMWSCGKTFSVASAHLAMRSSFLIEETAVTWPLAAWHYGINSSFTPTCTHTPAVGSCLGSCSSWCLCEICWEEVLLLSCASEAIGLAFLYGSWFTSDSQHSVCSNLESIHCYFKAVNPSFLSFDYSVSLSQGREIEKLLPQSGHAGMQQTSIWNDG